MAQENSCDIFHDIREAVSQTLEMAEARSKLSEETLETLAHLLLTRRGDGEIVLDVAGLQRMKAAENQWVDKDRNEQDRLVNPTRLPQLVPGLSGLTPGQYLAFVQRPLDRNGDNAPFLEATAKRLFQQYSGKEHIQARNKLFGPMQQKVAKILIDDLLGRELQITDPKKAEEWRTTTPAQSQFEMAAQHLNMKATEVLNHIFQIAVALTLIERIKAKALKIKSAKEPFEKVLRRLAGSDCGPTAKNRIKDIFLGYQKDLELMGGEIKELNACMLPMSQKLKAENFSESFTHLHRIAARLDALTSRWTIIITHGNNPDKILTDVDRIKGMHKVLSG